MGMPSCLRLPDGARHAAQIFVAVGDQQQAGDHARGQRRHAIADGGFQIGAAAGRAGGVAQLNAVLGSFRQRDRARAPGERDDAGPVAAVTALHLVGELDSRARSSGETLAEVSASTATATLV